MLFLTLLFVHWTLFNQVSLLNITFCNRSSVCCCRTHVWMLRKRRLEQVVVLSCAFKHYSRSDFSCFVFCFFGYFDFIFTRAKIAVIFFTQTAKSLVESQTRSYFEWDEFFGVLHCAFTGCYVTLYKEYRSQKDKLAVRVYKNWMLSFAKMNEVY